MQGFLRIILYGLLVYIVYKFIRIYQKLGQKDNAHRQARKSSGHMVKDEICNTYLPQEDSIKAIHQGKEYYFCSQECRQKFLESKK